MTNPSAATVEAVAELQLAAFLAGRGSVMQKGSAIKTVLKPAPSMDDFREMARASLTTQAVEPVAWMYHSGNCREYWTKRLAPGDRFGTETPLYAAPPSLKTPEQDA